MNIVFVGGGTAGHINPGIAIANKIKEEEPDSKICFIGTSRGLETDLVPRAGYELKTIEAYGLKKEFTLNNLKNIIKTENSNIKYIRLMDYFEQVKFKPLLSSYEPKDVNNCCYPLIGAKKIDNGVVKHIDVYSIDSGENDYISLCKQGNGGAGCCFIQRGKFSACSSSFE